MSTDKLVQEALDVVKLHLNEPALSCVERVVIALGDALKEALLRLEDAIDLRVVFERENADLKRRLEGVRQRCAGYLVQRADSEPYSIEQAKHMHYCAKLLREAEHLD